MLTRDLIQERYDRLTAFVQTILLAGAILAPNQDPDDAWDRTLRIWDQHDKELARMAEEDGVGEFRSPAVSSNVPEWSLRIQFRSDRGVFSETLPLNQGWLIDDIFSVVMEVYQLFNPFQVFVVRPSLQEFELHTEGRVVNMVQQALRESTSDRDADKVEQALQAAMPEVGLAIEMATCAGPSDFQISSALALGHRTIFDAQLLKANAMPEEEDDELYEPVVAAAPDAMQVDPVQQQLAELDHQIDQCGMDDASAALIRQMILGERQ